MKGWGWQSVHDPRRLPAVMKEWTNSIKTGKPFEMIFPIKGADGDFREFLTRVVPITNNAGEIYQWFGTNTDITERVKAEQELKESEARFRMFADSMPQIVWAADADGKLTYINKAFYNYSGLNASDNIEDEWMQIIHPEDREETIQQWDECAANGREFTVEHRFRRHDGEYKWQLTRAVPIKDSKGKVESWVATSTDIQQIKELDMQKDHFISIASHELKTPITSIKGYIQILESIYSESKDAFLKKSLSAVDKQIVKLTNLISDLLDLSKLKLGNLHLVKESFNMNELIEEVVEEMRLVKRDYIIETDLKTNAEVFADRERIAQVLVNFLTNATKYSPRNKLIQVRSVLKDNYFKVFVKDQGIGINKQSQEKIFERFYRVEGTSEKTYPGFGIGLFISSEIIHRHNGEIGVKSIPGKGSEFFFSLPVE
jgi:PAS domain S-box-containing protein